MSTTATNLSRDPALDGVRGIAIALVLFHHLVYYSGLDRWFWYDKHLFWLADSCWLGVDLFFVLSGFLITGILYETRNRVHYYRNFYARRVLRIFPLYFGFLLVMLLILPYWLDPAARAFFYESQPWYWSFLPNLHIALEGWQRPVSHFWSLGVEEQFYLLWPLLVHVLDRQQLLRVTACCMVTALGLRLWLPFGTDGTDAYVLLPMRMDSLAAGAFLALLIRGPAGFGILRLAAPVIAMLTLLALGGYYLETRHLSLNDPLVYGAGFSVIAIFFAACLALVISAPERSLLRRALSLRPMVALGRYSYGLYVIHSPVIWALQQSGLRADNFPRLYGSTLPGILVFCLAGLAISLALAMASYHFWETRFLRLKSRFPYEATVIPDSAPVSPGRTG